MDREAWREMLRGLSVEEFRLLRELVGDEDRAREAHQLAMLRIGDWVEFEDRNEITHRGIVARMNSRTIAVRCAPGEHGQPSTEWRVGVTFIRRIVPVEAARQALPEP